ncbi:hypothetical protein GT030_01575 [Streptomyces sp. SID1328]|nr:hypothetical protein [Streptomyces sp. SID1328]
MYSARSHRSDEWAQYAQRRDRVGGNPATKATEHSITDRLRGLGKWNSRADWGDVDHVEMKVVDMMEKQEVDHAEVVINNEEGPCVKAAPALSCSNTLDSLLGSKTLRVHWRDKYTGEMTSHLFGGRG